jgi:uncharacterized membrane protein
VREKVTLKMKPYLVVSRQESAMETETHDTITLDSPVFGGEDDYLSLTVHRPARECFSLFSFVERVPEWLRAVKSAYVVMRDSIGRPVRAQMMAGLNRATVGFSLNYRYSRRGLHVAWSTPEGSGLKMHGFVRFQPLELRSCLMTLCLGVDTGGLPEFADEPFQMDPAATAIADFRDYAVRVLRK